jgi:trehalose 6-phosphate phosphatase
VQLPPLLRKLADEPRRAAVVLDVDGTLAPIVARPEDARVPDETRVEIRRIVGRYGLVACVSGRPGADAARIVGVDGLRVVGEHGLELDPTAHEWIERIAAFADEIGDPAAERKLLTLSYHYRRAADEAAARAALDEVASRARAAGLVPRFGRKVLEVRPPVSADKGTAVAALLREAGLTRALYAGDDTTDLDAFREIATLEIGARVAVGSPEAPPALGEAADIVVDGTPGLLELLRAL